MHDPQTLAFSVRSPFKNKNGYRPSLIDIWHKDPENFRFNDGSEKLGTRDDDSCGWSRVVYSPAERDAMLKLASSQYDQLFARQIAEREGKDYAYVCNMPETTHEIVYWCWRAIKAHGKKGWQYGRTKNFLSSGELEAIMVLTSNPVDNVKWKRITNEEDFRELFFIVWSEYRRYIRPWYKHPRWHIHHWKIQVVFLRNFYRRYFEKCDICGKRGHKQSMYSDWDGTKRWCSACQNERYRPVANIHE